MEEAITRSDFLKKIFCGALGLLAFTRLGNIPVMVSDTSGSGENNMIQSDIAPSDHTKIWFNTGSGDNMFGINGKSIPQGAMCYWDNSNNGWKPTTATWA